MFYCGRIFQGWLENRTHAFVREDRAERWARKTFNSYKRGAGSVFARSLNQFLFLFPRLRVQASRRVQEGNVIQVLNWLGLTCCRRGSSRYNVSHASCIDVLFKLR